MQHTLKKSDFFYELPEHLIARYPLQNRSDSRLLVAAVESAQKVHISNKQMIDFIDFLKPEDLLVINNTRVVPARMFGHKISGGKVEVFIERLLSEQRVKAHIRASKAPLLGSQIVIGAQKVTIEDKKDGIYTVFSEMPWTKLMAQQGKMPIPPYLARDAETLDSERYQTVYAQIAGAVAAPTAGLHFDQKLLECIAAKGVKRAAITLHVGAGTFQPVRVENLNEHVMHQEWFSLSQEVVDAVAACRAQNGRVIAIGTTALRALESAAIGSGKVGVFQGDTDLFITPGYEFQVVDALFTNFHLPESTLLMLVSAFAGVNNIRRIYQHAITEQYRFFSYGDAMFLPHRLPALETLL